MRALFLVIAVVLVGFRGFAAEEDHATQAGGEAGHHASSGKTLESGADLNLLPPSVPNRAVSTWPSKVTLQEPAALAKVSGTSVTLKWDAGQGADSYHVQVATDPNFKWLVANEPFHKGTTFDVSGLEAGKQYFWRVAGMKSDNSPEYQKGPFVFSSFEAK